ncbi:MAG: hypothetical protein IJR17_00095 [Clostridia bacterium]|nr:hypothetical protein [Clostridia bacterium]
MSRSVNLLLLVGLVLLTLCTAALLILFSPKKSPKGEGVYLVKQSNFFSSPSGDSPRRTRLYPTDLIGTGRDAPANREICRRTIPERGQRA